MKNFQNFAKKNKNLKKKKCKNAKISKHSKQIYKLVCHFEIKSKKKFLVFYSDWPPGKTEMRRG